MGIKWTEGAKKKDTCRTVSQLQVISFDFKFFLKSKKREIQNVKTAIENGVIKYSI